MENHEIDLRDLRKAVNVILDHIVEDLGVPKIVINEKEDFFWDCPPPEMYDMSKKPSEWWTGRLSDDLEFVQTMMRNDSGYVAFMLTHLAPLLRYVGQKTKECSGVQKSEP